MNDNTHFRNTYVQIDNRIIENNARNIISAFPYKYYIAIVKGNAYGHGYGIIEPLRKAGINCFAVSMLEEAVKIRDIEPTLPIIMLQPVAKEYLTICAEKNISVCINDEDTFQDIVDSGLSLKLQFKVNCGMNRLGIRDSNILERIISTVKESDVLTLEGIFSHFHTFGINDSEYSKNLATFQEITKNIDLSTIPMVHLDKSVTMTAHEKPSFVNGVRIGVLLYGINYMYRFGTSLKERLRFQKREFVNRIHGVAPSLPYSDLGVKTAFALYSEVIQINHVKAGDYVGYGLLYQATKDEYCAVIDIGYMDGISRRRTGSFVAINGKKYPIIGEIGMGMMQVRVDESVKKHDRVTVIGDEIPIRSIARHMDSTSYEVMVTVDSSIPRKYIN